MKKMSVRLIAIITIFLCSSVMFAQRKRAFFVGVSHYDTALTGYQWNNINGVEDVNLISPIMRKQGFELTILLDEQATFENVNLKLEKFAQLTQKGDIVYLHFSTHGQPVEDLDGDENDGWDEAIVPIDAYKIYEKGKYEGEKHLTDDILNQYVKSLRKKIGSTGILYVVIDACHAGTSSRGNDDVVRGTSVGFTYHDKIYRPTMSKKSHYNIMSSHKLANVVFLEACRPDQVNMEIKIKGKRYGPLSYNIAQLLSGHKLTTNADAFLKHLKELIAKGGYWPNNQNLVTETSF